MAAAASPTAPSPAYWQSLRYLAVSRLVVAALLMAYLPLMRAGFGEFEVVDGPLFGLVAALYLSAAIAFLWLPRQAGRGFDLLLRSQVLVDLVALTMLVHAAGGVRSGLAILLILPTAGAAILTSARIAAFFAATAALLLLLETVLRSLAEPVEAPFLQAGLIGAALFAIVLVVNRLARRLDAQEQLAFRRGEDLRNQLAVTQAVIAEMEAGVVVLGGDGSVRAINRAAADMLDGAAGTIEPATLGRLRMAANGAAAPAGPGAASPVDESQAVEIDIVPHGGETRRLRARRVGAALPGADVVLVLDDLGRLEQRAQQLKLASMGRLSASIAHEIRNPLAAIRHANGLLAERLVEPAPRRLSAIVETNSLRIDRIIEDVLSIARRAPAVPEPLPAQAWLAAFVAEYVAQSGTDPARIACVVATGRPIWFDPGHLRQVLVNLLDNASRYATAAAGAIVVEWLDAAPGRPTLRIADDGPGIAASARQHLFEPFYTTEARGTGLGLHLARELCLANGARIRYEPPGDNPRDRGAFVIEPQQPSGSR